MLFACLVVSQPTDGQILKPDVMIKRASPIHNIYSDDKSNHVVARRLLTTDASASMSSVIRKCKQSAERILKNKQLGFREWFNKLIDSATHSSSLDNNNVKSDMARNQELMDWQQWTKKYHPCLQMALTIYRQRKKVRLRRLVSRCLCEP